MRPQALILGAALGLLSTLAQAQATPAGLWKTIDDATKKEKSLVRITDNAGVYIGKIEKLLDPTAKQDAGDRFYTAKLATARFYFAKLLPETAGLIRSARAGLAPLMAMDESMF